MTQRSQKSSQVGLNDDDMEKKLGKEMSLINSGGLFTITIQEIMESSTELNAQLA